MTITISFIDGERLEYKDVLGYNTGGTSLAIEILVATGKRYIPLFNVREIIIDKL